MSIQVPHGNLYQIITDKLESLGGTFGISNKV